MHVTALEDNTCLLAKPYFKNCSNNYQVQQRPIDVQTYRTNRDLRQTAVEVVEEAVMEGDGNHSSSVGAEGLLVPYRKKTFPLPQLALSLPPIHEGKQATLDLSLASWSGAYQGRCSLTLSSAQNTAIARSIYSYQAFPIQVALILPPILVTDPATLWIARNLAKLEFSLPSRSYAQNKSIARSIYRQLPGLSNSRTLLVTKIVHTGTSQEYSARLRVIPVTKSYPERRASSSGWTCQGNRAATSWSEALRRPE